LRLSLTKTAVDESGDRLLAREARRLDAAMNSICLDETKSELEKLKP
jgi:hypothetical protein